MRPVAIVQNGNGRRTLGSHLGWSPTPTVALQVADMQLDLAKRSMPPQLESDQFLGVEQQEQQDQQDDRQEEDEEGEEEEDEEETEEEEEGEKEAEQEQQDEQQQQHHWQQLWHETPQLELESAGLDHRGEQAARLVVHHYQEQE